MGDQERRDNARVKIDAFVRAGDGDRWFVFRTRDVSSSGLFLYTRVGHIYPFKIGASLQLELYDYDRFVTFKAVVVRVVRDSTPESEKFPTGFGLRIVEISADQKKHLEQMIVRTVEGKPPY